jgi:DNA polymerase I-like protein with 3'-5' exonuclease and polymerase domains/5'-3' exonuclease
MQTQAVYGFITIMRRHMKGNSSYKAAVAFDLKAPTFRHAMYDGYKAARKGMPDELAVQLPYIKRVLTAMGIPRFEVKGFEADDILGALAEQAAANGAECEILTGDRDSLQLIGGGVTIRLVKGKGDSVLYDTAAFQAEYGFAPERLIDLKALMGDSSDSIPGVKGIGEKTALELIRTYGSLDGVYDGLNSIKGPVRAKLEADRDMAYLSYNLAKIDRNAPVDWSDATADITPDNDELYRLFSELEFKSLIKSYGLQPPEGEEPPIAISEPADDIARYLLDPIDKRPIDKTTAEQQLRERGMWKLYTDIELPLAPVLREMERIGFCVDKDALAAYGEVLEEELERIARECFQIAGQEFNLNSTKQFSTLLFGRFGVTPPRFAKKLQNGAYSTDAKTLEQLQDAHPIVPRVLEYRKAAKIKSTYVDGLLHLIDKSGRIHTTFNQTLTATGRLSSSEPNLQNIPVRGEFGAEIRKFFIAEPGSKLIDADYSQIELRVLANISGDQAMIQAFRDGEDIHSAVAAQVFGVTPGEVTKEQRGRAKAVNFGILYGMGDFTLANDIGVSRAEAKAYIEAYLEKFSGVKDYLERSIEDAKERGYAVTVYGRRRPLPELKSSKYQVRQFGERVARNMPIQGAAADIIKIAMLKIAERFKQELPEARLISQVHDELIAEAPDRFAEQVKTIMTEECAGVGNFEVPLIAETKIADNWHECK